VTKSNRPPEVRPVGKRGMANDSMSSLNLSRALENARADSLTSENLAMALRRQTPPTTAQRPAQQPDAQRPSTAKGEK